MMLHAFGDLPVHHDDGHCHFFPFSEWRFASPVSYWDPHHYGNWFGLLEIGAVIAASWYMIRQSAVLRPWVAVTLVVYLLFWVYVYLVWM